MSLWVKGIVAEWSIRFEYKEIRAIVWPIAIGLGVLTLLKEA